MKEKDLLELGFKNESYLDEFGNYTQFALETDSFIIEYYGIDMLEIKLPYIDWFEVPNCKTIEDLKCLIRLFSK